MFKAGVNLLSAWDNYQCKHYAKPLSIADVVAELGKLKSPPEKQTSRTEAVDDFVAVEASKLNRVQQLSTGLRHLVGM